MKLANCPKCESEPMFGSKQNVVVVGIPLIPALDGEKQLLHLIYIRCNVCGYQTPLFSDQEAAAKYWEDEFTRGS